jgi:hypothetical protein
LIIEDGELAVINQHGRAELSPIDHPVRVGHETMAIDDNELARVLANGSIVALNGDGAAWRLVQVTADNTTVYAYFRELPKEDNFAPEIAAYKLDRMLGLGMVPVTVRREVDGKQGTLQFVPADTMTERERVTDGEGWGTPCPLGKQVQAMYVFDALIGNPVRTPSSMLYSPDDWLLILVDHEHSFGTGIDRPQYQKEIELVIGDQWRTSLHEVESDILRAELGDVLDERRLEALSDRRDRLIKHSMGAQH